MVLSQIFMNSSPEIYLNTTPKKHMKSFIYQSKSLQKEKNSNKRKSEFVVPLWKIFVCNEIYSEKKQK